MFPFELELELELFPTLTLPALPLFALFQKLHLCVNIVPHRDPGEVQGGGSPQEEKGFQYLSARFLSGVYRGTNNDSY